MQLEKMVELFRDREDREFLKFEKVTEKFSNRPDLHAFILLDKLVPGDRDMICSSEHDEYYLEVSADDLAASAITEDQVIDLVRCGVRWDNSYDCFAMFS